MSETTAYLLYAVFAIGGLGVYLMLPRRDRSPVMAGKIVGIAALAALIAVLATRLPVGSSGVYFYLFALIAIGASARVVTHPRPVYSALYFVLAVVAVAAMLVLQQAEFLAIALIIIYTGAIIVTYLFVIMLAQQDTAPSYDRGAREPLMAVLAGFVLTAAIAGQAQHLLPPVAEATTRVATASQDDTAAPQLEGNTASIGAVIMSKYIVALEIAGVLLLVSMVGAIALSRKRVPADGYQPPRRPVGQVGKEVEPF